jgi:TRAP-type C4-dicarboxylate transport system permease small subunit
MKVGNALFWLASLFAALILLWTASDYFSNLGESYPVLNVPAVLLAGAIWLVGLLCRHALT